MYSNQLFYNETELYSSSNIKGEYLLRKAISEFINSFRGAKTVPEQIIVGAGIQSLLFTLCVLFKNFTEYAAFENPGYDKARYIFEDFGFKTTYINVSGDGFSISDLEKTSAGIVYVSPSHQYPTGSVMPVGKRMHLLAWAKKNSTYILEDDYDSIIRFESKPVPCLQGMDNNQRVVYIGSFSKLLSPAFRISYMVLPVTLLEKYDLLKNRYTQSASKIEQLALAEFISEGHLNRHIRKIKKIYSEKNKLAADFLGNILDMKVKKVTSDSGLHMILDVFTSVNYEEISKLLKKNKISSTLINSEDGYHRISLSYSGFTFEELENPGFSDDG